MSETKRNLEMISEAPSPTLTTSSSLLVKKTKSTRPGRRECTQVVSLQTWAAPWSPGTLSHVKSLALQRCWESPRTLVLMPLSCTVPFQLISLFKWDITEDKGRPTVESLPQYGGVPLACTGQRETAPFTYHRLLPDFRLLVQPTAPLPPPPSPHKKT